MMLNIERESGYRKFQCSSASRKFLNAPTKIEVGKYREFQCSSASRKFLNLKYQRAFLCLLSVSVLFSEPKIPQSVIGLRLAILQKRFSALQRAENSSILETVAARAAQPSFSALQRAENSSIKQARAR